MRRRGWRARASELPDKADALGHSIYARRRRRPHRAPDRAAARGSVGPGRPRQSAAALACLIAAEYVARSAPDGYTFLRPATNTHTIGLSSIPRSSRTTRSRISRRSSNSIRRRTSSSQTPLSRRRRSRSWSPMAKPTQTRSRGVLRAVGWTSCGSARICRAGRHQRRARAVQGRRSGDDGDAERRESAAFPERRRRCRI